MYRPKEDNAWTPEGQKVWTSALPGFFLLFNRYSKCWELDITDDESNTRAPIFEACDFRSDSPPVSGWLYTTGKTQRPSQGRIVCALANLEPPSKEQYTLYQEVLQTGVSQVSVQQCIFSSPLPFLVQYQHMLFAVGSSGAWRIVQLCHRNLAELPTEEGHRDTKFSLISSAADFMPRPGIFSVT